MKKSARRRLLIALFLVALAALGAFALRRHFIAPPNPVVTASSPAEEGPGREILLYFAATDYSRLLPEAREIRGCRSDEECVRSTVQALLAGPEMALLPVLPPAALLRGVAVRGNTAELDFSRELISAHPGGSISELFTVYALADTLAVNFPHLRQVRILVEGNPVETLKGHVGLLEPIPADFSYTRPPEEERAAAKATGEAAAAAAGSRP